MGKAYVISILLALQAGLAQAAQPVATQISEIRFSKCRLQQPSTRVSVEAECGQLTVPEDRANPQVRSLSLAVARLSAQTRRGSTEPLFILAGGPGLAASTFYASAAPVFAAIRRDRDLILVDQRGTGSSAPLNCEFEEQQMWESNPAQLAAIVSACREQLTAKHDLKQFTTSVAVADLEAVRIALGYTRINIYGSSYGTRVALHYARRYPERTRALILDGVVPPNVVLGSRTPLDAEQALDQVLARCKADAECQQRFGDPRSSYLALREQLSKASVNLTLPDPRSGEPRNLKFDTQALAGVLRLATYSAEQAALLPLTLTLAAREQRFAPLATQFLLSLKSLGDVVALGMHNSVVCAEDVPRIANTAEDRARLQQTFLGVAQIDALKSLCEQWPRGPVDSDFHQPLRSNVPALLLSGTADPVTPALFGDRVAETLPNSLHLKLEGQGHGQLGRYCMNRLMATFLREATPSAKPILDTQCLAKQKPVPFFMTVNGPDP